MRKLMLLLVIIFHTSCAQYEKQYYDTGELFSEIEIDESGIKNGMYKKYYKDGSLKERGSYSNNKMVDSIFSYDINGQLISKALIDGYYLYVTKYFNENGVLYKSIGTAYKNKAVGWWTLYLEGDIVFKKEHYVLNEGESYLNQVIFYDNNGRKIDDKSNYYNLKFPDTLNLNKLTVGELKLVPKLSKKENFHMAYFWDEKTPNKIDSMYGTNEKAIRIWVKPTSLGKKKIKGYILETSEEHTDHPSDTSLFIINRLESKMYFQKDIVVIE